MFPPIALYIPIPEFPKRLMGASLLVFLNKTDIQGCMDTDEIRKVQIPSPRTRLRQAR